MLCSFNHLAVLVLHPLTLLLHSLALHTTLQTLPVTAELTAVALTLVNHALLVVATRVGEILANCALEEALASLTAAT